MNKAISMPFKVSSAALALGLLLLAAAWAPAEPKGSAAPSVMEVLRKFDEAQNGTTTFRAKFRQEKISDLLPAPDRTKGVLYMQKPGLLLLHYQEPKPAYYLMRDSSLLIYWPELKRAQEMNMGPRRSLRRFLEYFGMGRAHEKADKYFNVTLQEPSGIASTYLVEFLPARRRLEKHMEKASLWLDKGDYSVRKVEFITEDGETIRIFLESLERNVALGDVFKVPLPPDVKVEKINKLSEQGGL